jgi:ATP synthase protein I
MEEEKKKQYKQLARYSSIGLEMGFSVAIGAAMGYFLDKYFNTTPWLMILFLILGIVAAFRSLFRLMKDIDKDERKR